jgi:hypothetical protein
MRYFGLFAAVPVLMSQCGCDPACVPTTEPEAAVEAPGVTPVAPAAPVTVPATAAPTTIPASEFDADIVYGQHFCNGWASVGVDASAPAAYDTVTFKGQAGGIAHDFMLPLPLDSTRSSTWNAGLNIIGNYVYSGVNGGDVVVVFHDNDGLVPDREFGTPLQALVHQAC